MMNATFLTVRTPKLYCCSSENRMPSVDSKILKFDCCPSYIGINKGKYYDVDRMIPQISIAVILRWA